MSKKQSNPPPTRAKPAPPPAPPSAFEHQAWVGDVVLDWIGRVESPDVLNAWYRAVVDRLDAIGHPAPSRLVQDDVAGHPIEVKGGYGVITSIHVDYGYSDHRREVTYTISVAETVK